MAATIEVLENPSAEQFREVCQGGQRPVKIVGAVDHWKALQRWNVDYFREVLGEKTVAPTRSAHGSYDRAEYEAMKGNEYFDLLMGEAARKDQIYLAGLCSHDYPDLNGDFEHPPWVPKGIALRIFFGRDSLTGCHYHPYHQTCLTQLSGRKRVVFYAPGQFEHLYPKPLLSNNCNFSRINFRKVDERAFPRLTQAEPLECTIHAGEMLYIPLHWWHAVFGEGLNISGAFHWGAPLSYWHFPQPGLRCMFKVPFKKFPSLRRLVPAELRNR